MAPGRQSTGLPCKVSAQTDDTYGDGAAAPGSQRSCGPSARPVLHFTWTRLAGLRVEVSHSRRPVRRIRNPQPPHGHRPTQSAAILTPSVQILRTLYIPWGGG